MACDFSYVCEFNPYKELEGAGHNIRNIEDLLLVAVCVNRPALHRYDHVTHGFSQIPFVLL